MTVPRKAYGWTHGLGPIPSREGAADRECVAIGECRPPHKSSKSTRRWCRGKVGVEHQTEWRRYSELPNAPGNRHLKPTPETPEKRAERLEREGLGSHAEILMCVSCGKQHLDRRHVCHCGAVMTNKGKRWWNGEECPACGYTPWHQRTKLVNKQWVKVGPPRPKCRCETGQKPLPAPPE